MKDKYEKVKFVKGSPVYVLRGIQYCEKPDNTIIKKMMYCEQDNLTYIYLKRNKAIIELLCLLIIVLCIAITLVYSPGKIYISYNDKPDYYNGYLNINLVNDKLSSYPVICEVFINGNSVKEITLKPSEALYTISLNEYPKDVYIVVIYEYPIFPLEESYKLKVVERSIE